MTTRLNVGDAAPPIDLPTGSGNRFVLAEVDGPVVVYFYPAAMTPGCTKQSVDFEANLQVLSKAGYTVVGISPDPEAKLARFADSSCLTFPLASDTDHQVAEAYGAWGEKKNYGKVYQGLIRSTFVIDENKNIAHAGYNVKATGHVARLMQSLDLEPVAD